MTEKIRKLSEIQINGLLFTLQRRVTEAVKVRYSEICKEVEGHKLEIPRTNWDYILNYYYTDNNNNCLVFEDSDEDYDMIGNEDFILDVISNMFYTHPDVICGSNNLFHIFPVSNDEWVLAVHKNAMFRRKKGESLSGFMQRMYDEDFLDDDLTEYSFNLE